MTHSLDQKRVPIRDALVKWRERGVTPFHTPGHKGTRYPSELLTFFTQTGLACDLPSMDFTDNWFHPIGCIREAQRLAADLYGAADTFYLVNGSTIGLQAMMLAAVAQDGEIVTSRHMHMSVFSGLVLTGAVPKYLPCRWLDHAGPIPPVAEEVSTCLDQNPETRAVLITNPTYYGVGRDIEPIARVCHERGIPLLVDEAHGAHLHWLPPGRLRSALDCGADLVVQSVHKTLGSLVGTAQLHRSTGSLISTERVQAALNLLQSTSSSYLLLDSLDVVRHWLSQEGRGLFESAVSLADDLRAGIAGIDGLVVLDSNSSPSLKDCLIDPLRITVDVSGLGLSGFEVERILLDEFHVYGEFADLRNVVYVLGPADTLETTTRLKQALAAVAATRSRRDCSLERTSHSTTLPPMVLLPRAATFRKKTHVPLTEASGLVSGEVISAYPPGIPLICPGEQFTEEVIRQLNDLVQQGACIFSEDHTLRTVTVVN